MVRLYESMGDIPASLLDVNYDYCQFSSWYAFPLVRYTWGFCREIATYRFWAYKDREHHFWYSIPGYQHEFYSAIWNLARLFDYVETRMGWHERTRVHPTSHSNVAYIHWAAGWFQNSMSVSLATLFCRIGTEFYDGRSFDDLLQSHMYSAATMPAIYRFLDGYQHCSGRNIGWYNDFRNRSAEQCERLLVHSS